MGVGVFVWARYLCGGNKGPRDGEVSACAGLIQNLEKGPEGRCLSTEGWGIRLFGAHSKSQGLEIKLTEDLGYLSGGRRGLNFT